MRPQPCRPYNCMATAVAAALDLDAAELPFTGSEWEASYALLQDALAKLGWRLNFYEWPAEGESLASVVDRLTEEPRHVWIASVEHPSFGGDAHAVVMRGHEVAFYPDPTALRPYDELTVAGYFIFVPLDPAGFVYARFADPRFQTATA